MSGSLTQIVSLESILNNKHVAVSISCRQPFHAEYQITLLPIRISKSQHRLVEEVSSRPSSRLDFWTCGEVLNNFLMIKDFQALRVGLVDQAQKLECLYS